MSVVLTINGSSYDYPSVPDLDGWGPDATDWAVAVTSGMLQKAGGLFQLLAEVDFGTTYGLKSVYFKSRTANAASAGALRLANTDGILWRNHTNNGNLGFTLDGSDNILFNGNPFGGVLGVADTDSIDMTLSGNNISGDLNLSADAASALNQLVTLSIETDGLKAQIPNASIIAAIPNASAVATGLLTSADWSTFNAKQAAGSYITSLTGPITASGPGASATTITNAAVTLVKIANIAANSILGNNTGSPATTIELTGTQTTAMLVNVVGDSGAGGTKGLVPAPASGDAAANKFLKADGTWKGVGMPCVSGNLTSNGTGWANSSTSYGDFSAAASSAWTTYSTIGFPAVTKESANLPGISFTPTTTGYYEISVVISFVNGGAGSGAVFQLVNDTNVVINSMEAVVGANNAQTTVTLIGIHHIAAIAGQTFKVYGRLVGSGTTTIGGNLVAGASAMEWTVKIIYAP